MNVIAGITPTSDSFKINGIVINFHFCLAAIFNSGRGEIPQLYFCFADLIALSYRPTPPSNLNLDTTTIFWTKLDL